MTTQERVLIVEDEIHALTGLAELVSSWGYATETAADGLEALERIDSWEPAVIVTDLKMPRMNGLELLARLLTCAAITSWSYSQPRARLSRQSRR